MENFVVEETVFEPRIELNFSEGKFLFKGESRPENVHNFYGPIFKKLDEYELYLKSSNKSTNIECVFNFDYFNSSSSKSILDIIEKMANIKNNAPNANLRIVWFYDELDEDMREAGLEFEEITELKFEFCGVK